MNMFAILGKAKPERENIKDLSLVAVKRMTIPVSQLPW
jgi:hypothetical protein